MTSHPQGQAKNTHSVEPASKTLAKLKDASLGLGPWMSAALNDDKVCAEMKADIQAWLEAFPKEWFEELEEEEQPGSTWDERGTMPPENW